MDLFKHSKNPKGFYTLLMLSRRISTTDHRYYLSNLLRNSQHPSNIILLRWRVFLESKRFLNPSIIDAALSHLSELKRSLNYDTLKYIGNLFHEIQSSH
ncbi:MAG: hypothetical protein P8Y97_14905 [Candidatus Lokiarchaeota archaeon]